MTKKPTYPSSQLRLMCAMTNPPKPLGFDIVVDGKTIAVLELTEFKKAMAFFAEKDETWRQHRQRLTVVEPESNTPRDELEKRVNAMLDKELSKCGDSTTADKIERLERECYWLRDALSDIADDNNPSPSNPEAAVKWFREIALMALKRRDAKPS